MDVEALHKAKGGSEGSTPLTERGRDIVFVNILASISICMHVIVCVKFTQSCCAGVCVCVCVCACVCIMSVRRLVRLWLVESTFTHYCKCLFSCAFERLFVCMHGHMEVG
jgi:hypothetical protein